MPPPKRPNRPTRRLDGSQVSDRTIVRGAVVVLVGFLVLGGLLLGGSLLFGGGEESTPARTTASSDPSELPTAAVTTPEPSDTPSPSASSTGLTEASMTAFVGDYLARAAADPAAGWALLTPAFRQASGGFGSYRRFWGSVTSATPSGVFADPATGKVTYRVDYVHADGSRDTDSTRIRLVQGPDGGLLIDGEG